MAVTNQRVTNSEIIQAYKLTASVWKAAKMVGLCGQSVHERLQRLGYVMSNPEWTPEETEAACRLAKEGMAISLIADRLNRSYAAVAIKLSRMSIKHAYRMPTKPKRRESWTKIKAHGLMNRILSSGEPIARAARRMGYTTSGVVNAVQFYAPAKWDAYKKLHSELAIIDCPGCTRQFLPLTGKQRYCTERCRSSNARDKQYFGGKRMDAMGMSTSTCQLCLKKIQKGLSAHHMLGKENDADNNYLIALCPGCHNLVEMAATRVSVDSREFWENLVVLALMKSSKIDKTKATEIRACVDIEIETPQEETCESLF